jgi:predicted DCC family thiol-disulfide oxidoreductase YuxK
MNGAVRHLILYDGVCGLCNRMNQIVLKHDRNELFHFAALQSEPSRAILQRFHRTPDALDTFYVIRDYESGAPRLLDKSDAGLFVATQLGGIFRLSGLLKVFPRFLRNRIYDFIARHRYRVFGRQDVCLRPNPEYMRRFIDL